VIGWIFLAVRYGFLFFAIAGTAVGMRQAGRSPNRHLVFMAAILIGSSIFAALIYDHFKLWHWLFG
jgi:hypothetical protein